MLLMRSQRQTAVFDLHTRLRFSFIHSVRLWLVLGCSDLYKCTVLRERALLCLMGDFACVLCVNMDMVSLDLCLLWSFVGVAQSSNNDFAQRRLDFGEAKSNFIILIIHVVVEFVISGLFFHLSTPILSHKMGEGVV